MPKLAIPLQGDAYSNVDEASLDIDPPVIYDAYTNEKGHTVKRPGLKQWVNLNTNAPVDGVYWWDDFHYVLAVSAGRIWRINTSSGSAIEVTGDALRLNTRVSFTSDGARAYMANGGRIVTYPGSGATAYVADSNAPTSVDHLGYLDRYILANEVGLQRCRFSDLNDGLTWTPSQYFEAETLPDALLAMFIRFRQIFLFGSRTLETWYDDGSTPFIRNDGSFVERGLGAAYSPAFANNTWFWIDNFRRVCVLNGVSPTVISIPMDSQIAGISTVSNARGDAYAPNGREFYVLTFPTDGRTLVYNVLTGGWAEWSYWNPTTGQREAFRGNCYAYAKDWNLHLVGDRANGIIYKMSPDYFSDDGDAIRVTKRTAFSDFQDTRRKQHHKLWIYVVPDYKGAGDYSGSGGSDPVLTVRWRDEDMEWWQPVQLPIPAVGPQNLLTLCLEAGGQYRKRQYEFDYSANGPFSLVKAEEEFDWLAY